MPTDIKTIITKEFLEHILKKTVDSFTYFIGTKPGDNYLSFVYRVEAKVKGDDKCTSETKSLFLKCYPENSATCTFIDSVSIFPTEYFVYDRFIPSLNGLAREIPSHALRHEALVNVAKFYGGNIVPDMDGEKLTTFDKEPWTKENLIILEDLRPMGYQMLDRTKGLDMSHCLLTLNQLANIHALSWIYKGRKKLTKLVDIHPYLHDSMYRKENEPGWRPIVENLNKNALNVIQQEFGVDSDVSLKLKDLISLDTLEIIRNAFSCSGVREAEAESLLRVKPETAIPSADVPWVVATHGDCWINNLLFTYSDEAQQSPSSVVLIDLQAFREACLTSDLAYFLYSSTKPAMRKESTEVLLKAYFDKFTSICQAMGESPPPGFTFETLQRRWRRARVSGLLLCFQFIAFVYKPSLLYGASDERDAAKKKEMESSGEAGEPTNDSLQDAYPGLDSDDGDDDVWRKVLIETVLQEYNEGVL